jgi:hypothetical protein
MYSSPGFTHPRFHRNTQQKSLLIFRRLLPAEMPNRLETLVGKMYALRNSLDLEIKRLIEEGVEYNINSLGVVQTQGHDIDRLCGELAALKDVLRSSGAWQESWRK